MVTICSCHLMEFCQSDGETILLASNGEHIFCSTDEVLASNGENMFYSTDGEMTLLIYDVLLSNMSWLNFRIKTSHPLKSGPGWLSCFQLPLSKAHHHHQRRIHPFLSYGITLAVIIIQAERKSMGLTMNKLLTLGR